MKSISNISYVNTYIFSNSIEQSVSNTITNKKYSFCVIIFINNNHNIWNCFTYNTLLFTNEKR
jgi:hypothetical protein